MLRRAVLCASALASTSVALADPAAHRAVPAAPRTANALNATASLNLMQVEMSPRAQAGAQAVCLFGTRGETCDSDASTGLMLSLPYGEKVSALPFALRFEYAARNTAPTHIRVQLHCADAQCGTQARDAVLATSGTIALPASLKPRDGERGARLEIAAFNIPAFGRDPFPGRVYLTVTAIGPTGWIGGVESAAAEVRLEGRMARAEFTPLFYAPRSLAQPRRFSGTDSTVGYDGWATYDAIAWLNRFPNLYFNDISALHAAAYRRWSTSRGRWVWRSILGHDTHHDGLTFDMRYASGLDPSGALVLDNGCLSGAPFTAERKSCGADEPGGAILAALEAAAETLPAEAGEEDVAALNEARRTAQNWIVANRRLFRELSSDAQLIYVSNSGACARTAREAKDECTIYDALVHGRFGDTRLLGPAQPGEEPAWVGNWMSGRLRSSGGHNDHFHIALRAPHAPAAAPTQTPAPQMIADSGVAQSIVK